MALTLIRTKAYLNLGCEPSNIHDAASVTKRREEAKVGDFLIRLFTYGAVPFLTWIAAHFPAISHTISKLLQSGLSASK